MFATVVGLTTTDQLVTFDTTSPGVVSAPVAITGLATGESILSLDYRPANGQLVALGSSGRLYSLSQTTGTATQIGAGPISTTVDTARTAIDFNPRVDRIRVVSASDQNYRLNPGTAAVAATDTTLAYASTDANASANPNLVAIAYNNNFASTSTTTLYGIDSALDTLVLQGSVGGSPDSPDTGLLTTVGALGVDASALSGFDIAEVDGVGYASFTNQAATASILYSVNLASGAATSLGAVATAAPLRDLAVIPVQRTIVGLVTGGTQFATFSPSNLSAAATPVNITGLQPTESIVGIDFRPATGALLGVGSTGRLYAINLTSGAATQIGTTTFSPALDGTNFGIDFNPTVDRLRLVSNADQNARINPDTGAIVDSDTVASGNQADTTLAYATTDAGTGANPNVTAVAYTNNIGTAAAGSTSLYGIDTDRDTLVLQGSLAGATTTVSPNGGELTTVGALGIDVTSAGFDIAGGSAGVAYLAANVAGGTGTQLYSLRLSDGNSILLGTIGAGTTTFSDIAVALNVVNFSAATSTVAEGGTTLTLTVNRTGDSSSTTSVSFATAGGTATANTDFTSNLGTLTFLAGETSKTISISIAQDSLDELDETFTTTLSGLTSGFAFGNAVTSTATITDDDNAPTISVADTSSLEGNAGGTNSLTFTVTLSAASGQSVTVSAASVSTGTNAGTGTLVTDYTALAATTLTFAPGETTRTFSVAIVGDAVSELNETVGVVLTSPTNATLSDGVAVGTITNDDSGSFINAEPQQPGRTGVVVNGTAADDVIVLRRSTAAATRGQIEVVINGTTSGTFPTRNVIRLSVFAGAGDDDVRLDTSLRLPVLFLGGDGNDLLIGGTGRDILIGGAGIDALYGRGGEDILLGGSTNFDTNFNGLAAVHQRWVGPGNFSARSGFVRTGNGITGAFAFSATTIVNDATRDFLAGEASENLFLASAADLVTDDVLRGVRVTI